jgi:hypothetical protein
MVARPHPFPPLSGRSNTGLAEADLPGSYAGLMSRSLWATPLVLFLLAGGPALAGCSGSARPSDSASAGTVVAPIESAGSPAPDDPPGSNTCHLLLAAVGSATLMEPGVVGSIATASSTADAPVADSALRLATAYAAAVTAKGTAGEPDAIAAVSAAGAEMSGVCDDSGLATVG